MLNGFRVGNIVQKAIKTIDFMVSSDVRSKSRYIFPP